MAKTEQVVETTGTVEKHSYDYIPLNERRGKPRHLFSVWFGENIQILAVVTGSIGVVLGLGLMWTLVAIVVGNVVGALFMAFHSAQGPKLGLPQMIQSRAQFGYHGGLLPTVIALFMYLVYGAAGIVPCGQALQAVFGGSLDLWIVVCTIPMVGLAIFGYNYLHRAMRIQTVVFVVLFAVLGIWLLVHGIPAPRLHAGHFIWGAFLGAVSAYAVWQISYAPYVSDYSRYLPPDQTKNAFGYTYSGTIVGTIVPMAIGAGLAALYPTLGTIGAIHQLTGGLLTFLIGISIVMPNSFNIYGGIITTLTIGTNFKEFRSTARLRIVVGLIIGALMLVAAIVGAGNFVNNLYNYLLILLYFLIPWTAINLTDFYLVRRGQYRTEDFFEKNGPYGLWNWTGLGVYAITFLIEIPFMATPHFTGFIAKALNGGDITWIVGTVVAVPLYYVLDRARLRPAEGSFVTGLLEGRHVVVTGAGSGIGRATAGFAAESGAKVAAWDIVPGAARQTAKDTGGIDCTCDVTDPDQVVAAAARTFDAFGTVEGLVNAAGIFEIDGGVERGELDRWNRTIATNLTSVFLISHAVVSRLPDRSDTAIVNIASMAGLRGFPEEAAYDASKGGVVNLTRQMAVDLARRGIRVNAIAPGEIETRMMLVQQRAGESYEALRDRLGSGAPLGRVGQPEEIGQVATFLLSPLASYITGAIISVDGGQTAR